MSGNPSIEFAKRVDNLGPIPILFDNVEIKDDDTATETGICCPNFDLEMNDNFKCIIEGANGFRPSNVPLPPIIQKCQKGENGQQGQPGVDGARGRSGGPGEPGIPGNAGPKGDTGTTGLLGPIGAPGI